MLFWNDHNAHIDLHVVLQVFEFMSSQRFQTHCAIFLALFVNHFPQSTKPEEQIRTHSPHPAGYAFSCQTSFIHLYVYTATK